MKIIRIKSIILGFFLSISLMGCDDLERFPNDAIEQSQSFQTLQDAATWNNGLYAAMRGAVYGPFMFTTDIQADQLNATLDYGNRNGNPHRWEGFLADDGALSTLWSAYYFRIRDINAALEGFENIDVTPEETSSLELYRSEAYLARAFYYHNLVVRFAPNYDPSSASSDLGVPLVLEFDITERPARNTVEEVYQQILSDIEKARPALSQVSGEQGAYRFNIDVLTALEARVKLHMEDWEGAKLAADKLIASGRYPLIDNQEQFTDMWTTGYDQEVIMNLFVSAPNELANTNSIYLGYNGATNRFTPDFLPSQWVIDLYEEDDIRRDAYFSDNDTIEISGVTYTDLTLVNKYPGNPEFFTGANTNYQHEPIVFRIAELYLISAEAGLNLPDVNSALNVLNELRVSRGLDALDSSDDLVNSIMEERTRELAFEGFRLDDLRRWDMGFTRREPQNTLPLVQGDNFYTKSVEASNPKFIWGIPTNDITINDNLEQNPGW